MRNHAPRQSVEAAKTAREKGQEKTLGIQTHMAGREGQTSYDFVFSTEISELLALGKRRSTDLHGQVLISHTSPLPREIDPIQLFAKAKRIGSTVNYWALPTKGSWMVGAGEAAEITTEGPLRFKEAAVKLQNMIRSAIVEPKSSRGPVFLGGFRFKSEPRIDPLWKEFNDGLLTLPRWMIASTAGQCSLTFNVALNGRADIDELGKELASQAQALFSRDATPTQPFPASANAEPVADGWGRKVEEALDAINVGKLSKVTLARTMKLQSETTIAPEAILRSLTTNYPECRTFAFCRHGTSFIGASPEELVSLNGASVTSTCLAGSAPRGDSEIEDVKLSNWLLGNEKERREHKVVVDWVSERLRALCDELRWNEVPHVLRLGNVQHLATSFAGSRTDAHCVLDFVEALHPTPAVGGMPLGPALELIAKLEGFDRGWYTGPVGWVDGYGNGEFAIAIRCALLRGREAILYAGDGIVAGSDPETEDRETTMKFKPLLTALGVT